MNREIVEYVGEDESGDLLHRIDEEFSDDSPPGLVEIADARKTHLMFNGGDTVSIMEGAYQDNPGSAFPSEFDHILRNYADAQAAFPSNDLDAHAQIREEEREEENKVAPFSCINPASYDRGVLGQTVTLQPGLQTATSVFADGDPQMVAFWPGDDREACPVVVTCAPVLPYNTNIVRAVAQIKWGANGAKFVASVDIGAGFQLSLNASNVYLQVYLEGGDFTGDGVAIATMSTYLVAGSIGFQPADHQQAIVRSVRSGSIAAAGEFTALRPAFATSLLGFERNDVSGPTTLEFLDQNGSVRFTRQYAALSYISTPIPLSGEIASVVATNGAATSTYLTLTFGLF